MDIKTSSSSTTPATNAEVAEQRRLALEIAGLGAWQYDPEADEAVWDARAREIFGFTSGPISRQRVLDAIHPDDRPIVTQHIERAFGPAGTGRYEAEYRIMRADGETRWVITRGRRVTASASGNRQTPGRLVGTVMDVTDQVRTRRALEENQRRLEAVLQVLPLPLFIADADGRLQLTNPAADEIWGPAPLSGGTTSYAEDYRAWWPATGKRVSSEEWGMARVLSHGEVVTAEEMELEGPDGQRRTILNYARPIRDVDGKITGGVAVNVDITQRKQAELAVRESEQRFRLMADAAPVLIWISDTEKRCTWFNKQWLEFVGRTMEQEKGMGWAENVHPEDVDRCLQTFAAAFDARRNLSMEYRLRRCDGQYRWVLDNGRPLYGPGGQFTGYVGSCIDITERKREELLLAAQNRALARVAGPGSLEEALTALTQIVEEHSRDGVTAAIMLVNADGSRLHSCIGPGLPQWYREAVDGVEVRPDLGTCAAAASLNEPVVTPDIGNAPSWKGLAHLPLSLGLKAAWSMPIRGSTGRVLGTFGTYFRECREPTGRERQIVEGLCQAAALAIERRQAEAALRKSEQRLRLALDTAKLGTWSWDPSGDEVIYDARTAEMFGFGPDQCVSLEWLLKHSIHTEDGPHVTQVMQQALTGGSDGHYRAEFRIRRADGAERWILGHGRLLNGSGLVGTTQDITERKLVEEQLRRNRDTFYHLIQNNPFGIYVVDADFRLAQVSRGSQKVFSSVRPLLGRDFAEVLRIVWTEPFASEAIGRFRHTLETGEPYTSPSTVERRQDIGEIEAYDWRIERIVLPDGRFGVVCYFYDLSERQRWEAAIRDREARLRQMADAMPQVVWITRPDGYHEHYNRKWYEFTGVPEGSTDGDGWNGLFHPDDQARAWATWRRSLKTGEPYEIEYRLRHHSGEYRWFLGRALPVRDEHGQIVKWFGTCTDIHDQKLQREELARAKEQAERASEAKSEFLATLSHELRTPLTPVLLTTSLMESHPALPEDLRDDVETIRRNVELESQLISDLLDLTRIERGKLQLDMQDVDLHLIIRSAIEICQREASAKLVVELNARHHTVRGDSTRLQQIFWNLISNAVKFTPAEGTVTIRSIDGPEGFVRVQISDTGVGIDPAVLPKLFNAFEQGETRALRQQAGLGLGLTISRKLAEAHGGTITAHSQGRGHGATFILDLPATRDALPRTLPRSASPIAHAERSLDVLLVEDHGPTLEVMTKLLQRLGHRVTGATSVASAATAAAQNRFDLIISDLGLPDGSGLDLMRQVHRQYAGRAIALTGYGMESDIAASRDAGFALHLIKPVDFHKLQAGIAQVAGQ